MKPTLAITMGDPLGIGPEIILKSLPKFRDRMNFLVYGDARLLAELPSGELQGIENFSSPKEWNATAAGAASVAYLKQAMADYDRGKFKALVTAPISKSHVNLAGFPHPGHTEFLAHHTGTVKYVMMMATPKWKVSLVTIHLPLKEVSAQLRPDPILDTIEITHQALVHQFHLKKPRVAVCGLNPHAGEGGLLGEEEIEVIGPAIEMANQKGYGCVGPVVPDAVFHEAQEGKWDAIICMYHDQGLIPFKMAHFYDGVNVTLGLPLIRTSPDHGTAFEIAGKGIADTTSMEAAIRLASDMIGEG